MSDLQKASMEKPEALPKEAPAYPIDTASARNDGAAAFVFGCWALVLFGQLLMIGLYAQRVPFIEDWWLWVPYLTGHAPVTFDWIWRAGEESVVPEHREPIFKLIMYTLLKIGHGDFRLPMVVSSLALSAIGFALIRVARSIRGSYAYSDAFLPIATNMFGYSTVYANNAIGFLSSTLFGCTVLMVMAKYGTRLTLGSGIIAGLALIGLPLSGPYGMVYIIGVDLWYFACFIHACFARSRNHWRNALVFGSLGVMAQAFAIFYMWGLKVQERATPPQSLEALQFVAATWAASLGMATQPVWPWSGWVAAAIGILSTLALIAVALLRRGRDRNRAIAMMAFMIAMFCLAYLLAVGRMASLGLSGAWNYYIFPMPFACFVYFAWLVTPPRVSSIVQMCLFSIGALALALNLQCTLAFCKNEVAQVGEFAKDLEKGVPIYQLLARHHMALQSDLPEEREMGFYRWLADARIGPFRYLKEDPPFREIEVPTKPYSFDNITWTEDVVAHGTGAESWLDFKLSEPTNVAVLKIESEGEADVPYANCRVYVFNSQQGGQASEPVTSWTRSLGYIAIDKKIDTVRIQPSTNPFTIWVKKISVLTPADGEPASGQ